MKKVTIKKSTLTTIITVAAIIFMYFLMNGLNNAGKLSNVMSGLLIRICVWSMMAVSLNLVVGILGELSLGHAGFMYIGAFTGSFFTQVTTNVISNELLRFVLGMVVGAFFAALFGILIGSAVLRLQGDYLAIVTLAFGEIIKGILGTIIVAFDKNGFHFSLDNTTDLIMKGVSSKDIIVKGSQGILKIQRSSTFLIGIILLILTVVIVMNLVDSRSGRAIKAVRDNKIAAETVGINISKFRLLAFTISATIAGVAGVLYSHNLGMLQSSKFDFNTSINVLVMVVLGGMGNIPGSIIAAIVLTILPEKMRFLNDYRMIIYAVVLIVLMIFTWNPKCIEFRKMVSAKFKSIFSKKKEKISKEVQ